MGVEFPGAAGSRASQFRQDLTLRLRRSASFLAEIAELFERYSKLPQDFEKERGPDLPAAVKGNSDCPAIRVIPAFMGAGLPSENESEFVSDVLEIARSRARHA